MPASDTPKLDAAQVDLGKPILPQLEGKTDEEKSTIRAAAAAGVAAALFDNVLAYGGAGKLEWTDKESGLTLRLVERPVYAESFPEFAGPALRVVLAVSKDGLDLDLGIANPFFFPCPRLHVRVEPVAGAGEEQSYDKEDIATAVMDTLTWHALWAASRVTKAG